MSDYQQPTVGKIREQTALCDSRDPVILTSKDGSHRKFRVVSFYPDTVDDKGNWTSTFKINIELIP